MMRPVSGRISFTYISSAGFTLVELMVAMILGLLAAGLFYRSYGVLAGAAGQQDQLVEQGHNLRVGINQLARDLRMAGYNPLWSGGVETGFLVAEADTLRFTRDLDGDAAISADYEDVSYRLSGPGANGAFSLQRQDFNGATDAIVDNVDALNFVYLDGHGAPLSQPVDGRMAITAPPVTDYDQIRMVEITMVVRTTNEDYSYLDNICYRNNRDSDGDGMNDVVLSPRGDHFRRRAVTALVKPRNLGRS